MRVPRSRRDGLAWARRRSVGALRQRQSLRPEPQPGPSAHRARGSFARCRTSRARNGDRMSVEGNDGGGILSQPRAVWAVAFAAVVSFMGLGLVDPILPAIAKNLHASPSQVELLFTSYFAVTGLAMLVSSVVASRIGAKRTLLAGLVLIIAFSAAAG